MESELMTRGTGLMVTSGSSHHGTISIPGRKKNTIAYNLPAMASSEILNVIMKKWDSFVIHINILH